MEKFSDQLKYNGSNLIGLLIFELKGGGRMKSDEATRLYNSEQKKYYEYCGYISSYERKISEYRSERQKKSIAIDSKKDEIKKNNSLLEAIGNTTHNKDAMYSHLKKINKRVGEASTNFSTMVSASAVKAANLTKSFGEDATKADSKLTEIYQNISNGKKTISGVIDGMKKELKDLESDVAGLDSNISKAQGMIDGYEKDKQRCLANMAYYKKFM